MSNTTLPEVLAYDAGYESGYLKGKAQGIREALQAFDCIAVDSYVVIQKRAEGLAIMDVWREMPEKEGSDANA